MDIEELRQMVASQARREAIKKLLASKHNRTICIDGLAGSSAAMLFSCLPQGRSPYLIIANDMDEAGYIYFDLCQMCSEANVLIFPSGYKRDIKYGQVDAPSEILRTEVLNKWHSDRSLRWVVTCPEALAERVLEREQVENCTITLRKGGAADLTAIEKQLRVFGFSEQDYVYEPGQFAVRGSILDVYSYANELPYRIDFFGDEIDSIRTFNVETQLSEAKVDEVSIINGTATESAGGVSLLEYIGSDAILVCRDKDWLLQRVKAISEETLSESAVIAGEGDHDAMKKVVDCIDFTTRFSTMRRIDFHYNESNQACDARLTFHFSPQAIYHKNFDLISDSFHDFLQNGYTIYILSDSEKQIERLKAIFEDRADDIRFTPVVKTIHEGFVDNELKLCVFTDHQIFDRFHKYNLKSDRARSGKLALSLKELNQIEVGDYIVHVDHGVGKFGGLVRTSVNGKMQEMIKLIYLNDDIIFVSIHALHKLAKYRGKEGVEPRINKLGSGAWNRMKERTKSKLKDIARDLIKLYAARKEEKGFAFSPDGYLQQELEASFIYEDTPDQLKATNEVKADMEKAKPMDRLICGDVGFGKTEVAIRAAFKASTDGKQTAVLVPTTVLAFQHYATFSERLKDFPVNMRIEHLRIPEVFYHGIDAVVGLPQHRREDSPFNRGIVRPGPVGKSPGRPRFRRSPVITHASAPDNPDLELRNDIRMKFGFDFEAAERPDGRIDLDAAVLDGAALRSQLLGDHPRRDRAEQLIVVGRLHRDRNFDSGELFRQRLRLGQFLLAAGRDQRLARLDQPQRTRRGLRSQPLRNQIVPGISRSDVHLFAGQAELLDIIEEDQTNVSHRFIPPFSQ